MELEHKHYTIKDQHIDESRMEVEAYASVFGIYDSDDDRMFKGCFSRSIEEWGHRIKLVSQHNISKPIAKLAEIKEDDHGLFIKAQFGRSTTSRDAYLDVADGILSELSFGFRTLNSVENEKGGHDIKDVKLYEVSLVTMGANPATSIVSVKHQKELYNQKLDALLKYIKRTKSINKDTAFELERMLLSLGISSASSDKEESDSELVDLDLKTSPESVNDSTIKATVNKEQEAYDMMKSLYQQFNI